MAMNIDRNTHTVTEALRSVQDGLKALQTIQIQTAQAHQKFLETQNEASRALLELVKRTSRMAGLPFDIPENLTPVVPGPAAEPRASAISQPTPWATPSGSSVPAPISGTASGSPAAADIPADPLPAGSRPSPTESKRFCWRW
jgi:hypothetical protein